MSLDSILKLVLLKGLVFILFIDLLKWSLDPLWVKMRGFHKNLKKFIYNFQTLFKLFTVTDMHQHSSV